MTEIRTVICRLLDSADPDAVVKEVERVYSADAVLEAPLLIWKGRDKIAEVSPPDDTCTKGLLCRA